MADTNAPFVIEVDDDQLRRWFGELIERGENLGGLMADIGEQLTESTKLRFTTGIGPDGVAWKPLKDGSGRTPLVDSGRMGRDIFPSSGPDWVEISASARQARWHQEGTGIYGPKGKPYVIAPKNKKALAFGPPASRIGGKGRGQVGPAYVVRKVIHPGIPARPFMGLSAEDGQMIDRLAMAWLDDPVA